MYKIKTTTRFKKDFKKLKSATNSEEELKTVILYLQKGTVLPKKYKDHALIGNYKGYRECHIRPDWLLIYQIDKTEKLLTLVRTGSHSDLF